MARVQIGGGRWFDPEKAERWKEARFFDGNNHVSVATGSQFDHEWLYRTASGTWILHRWSQWQGSTDSYAVIDDETAYAWLIDNEEHDSVPEAVLAQHEL